MKRIFAYLLLFPLFLAAQHTAAQQYRNEWIDFSRTYYKFKVGAEGIYRVDKAALNAAGVPQANGTQYVMYCNGMEIPLYVTTNGAFGVNDYLEFFGEPGNGTPDKDLFANPGWQADVRKSLFTDTAAYFLTVNNSSSNLRYTNVPNTIVNPPAALNYCWASAEVHYNANHSPGRHYATGYPIFFSEFNNGEGFTDAYRSTNQPFSLALATPNFSAQQNADLQLALLRNTYNISNNENVKLFFNNQQIADSTIAADATKHFNLTIPASLLTANNTIQVAGTVTGISPYDIMGCSYLYIRYPRNLDLSGLNYFKFELNASATTQYIELKNFNHNGTAPKLYDVTNRQWYSGDISISGLTRFLLQPSFTGRQLVLVSTGSSRLFNISPAKTVQFTDYSLAANQGDYVIVSGRKYAAITNGRNYVQDYSDYRSSLAGGGRNSKIAYVEDLYDQFAYGVETHPLSIRNFMRYAYDKWTIRPHDLFLIGKGVSYDHNAAYLPNPASYNFSGNIPTYGFPGSDVDFVNFLPNKLQAVNVGRLSAWSPAEIGQYLDKVKGYESALATPMSPDYLSELWKKQVLHAAGGGDAGTSAGFLSTLTASAYIIKDTSYGAVISNISKTSTDPIDMNLSTAVDSLINNGLSLVTYHGHASQSTFELSTLNNPEKYHNGSRLPHILGLGCDVAYIYTLSTAKTLGERYLGVQGGGAISMIAADNFQYADFHQQYLPRFYTSISRTNYGKTIGDHHRAGYNVSRNASSDEKTFMHIESMLLQGDPAVPVFGPSKPDYHVSASRMSTLPTNVTTDIDSFTLKVVAYNLAKALSDTVSVKIEHINPSGSVRTLAPVKLVNLYYSDTLFVKIPVDKIGDLGLNKYRVTIDDVNKYDETSETNNSATLDIFIYSDNVTPVYPQEFAIVNQQNITLKASTLNAFRPSGRYMLEIDTTELFNSSIKQQTTITSIGGIIKWTPAISYKDSTVYYWRASVDSLINGEYRWTNSSFIYLANGSAGWNQSHYYQYQKNGFDRLTYGGDRVFRYFTGNTDIAVYNAVYSQFQQTTPWDGGAYSAIAINGVDIQQLGCPPWAGTLQIVVIDSSGAEIWKNAGGQSGSYDSCYMEVNNKKVFEFGVNTLQGRNYAKHFLDSIPNNHYVLIKNMINDLAYDTAFIDEWKADQSVNGMGNSLYHTIYNMGFTAIDSFYKVRPFIFFRMKGNTAFPITQAVGRDSADTLIRVFNLPTRITKGSLFSTAIGPAKEWKTLKWQTSAADGRPQHDRSTVIITGIDTANLKTVLYSGVAKDTPLNFINAGLYPQLLLQWYSQDSVDRSSAQLDYWRVLYSPLPEAALNPASYYSFSDSAQVGQTIHFAAAIENLTNLPMDSMLVRYKVIDANNTTHTIAMSRYRPLPGNDTLIASVDFDPSAFPGNNMFFVEANPDNDQPEQYHPNNLGYIPFKIDVDNKNPLIDVTFDGVHILDRDIVSAKPFIKIALKDENKYLKLDDTSLLTLSVRNPNDLNAVNIPFNGSVSKFIPAQGNKNEAYIEYRPSFEEDGIYELVVNGKDKAGNAAGKTAYKISFEVVNKSTITHVLNYPNPFSTSTAFVFTLTGSQVPTQFKIQILTVTGKVVREITRQELGAIHIGRNITDYKWDGKDQYGQMLGNGVYFYRVVTSLNGSDIEHKSNGTDKFFKNGYGKMYIMR